MEIGRFAPSTTGPSHPGTLLAGLLAWLDARSVGGRIVLRLEDIDPERCRPEWAEQMRVDLAWLGLDFDAVERQAEARERHEAALDRLAAAGALYPCACSRARIEAQGLRGPEGGFRYPNTCRVRALPAGGWRATAEPLRARMPEGVVCVRDEGGTDLSQDVAAMLGDPVVRRRDGAIAYMLAVVVDDAACGVTRVVRGRDLASSTATQVALHRWLGLVPPRYRHHFLLLEERGAKLAKLHGSVSVSSLRTRFDGPGFCGWLAHAAGLRPTPAPITPRALLAHFSWPAVRLTDLAWE